MLTDKEIDDIVYLGSLPYGSDIDPQEKILCAANKYGDIILCGVRHGDGIMDKIFNAFEDVHKYLDEDCDEVVEGFVTTKGRFVDRQQAWKIALANRQIIRTVGNDSKGGGTLYSENLY